MPTKQKLTLVANPGSQSRKYAVFQGKNCLAAIHFEVIRKQVHYSVEVGGGPAQSFKANLAHIAFAATKVFEILHAHQVIETSDQIASIGLRIVAPSTYFQENRRIDAKALAQLKACNPKAVIHINAVLQELDLLSINFPKVPIIGVSDSAFMATKPDHLKSYAIPRRDAKKLDIWRFGYHGLSLQSVVESLIEANQLADKTVVCHLGGGASLTALHKGTVVDTTMGYTPLEGLTMATRSGSIDPVAVESLRQGLKLSPDKLQEYLSLKSGLLGVSGISSDIRELLESENTHESAKLALAMYVSRVQQAVGQMVAQLGGIDTLVFTGSVGERSAIMRQRIMANMHYLHLSLDKAENNQTVQPSSLARISPVYATKHVLVVPCNEAVQIAQAAQAFVSR